MDIQEFIIKHHACPAGRDWAKGKTLEEIWTTCPEPAWLYWLLIQLHISTDAIDYSEQEYDKVTKPIELAYLEDQENACKPFWAIYIKNIEPFNKTYIEAKKPHENIYLTAIIPYVGSIKHIEPFKKVYEEAIAPVLKIYDEAIMPHKEIYAKDSGEVTKPITEAYYKTLEPINQFYLNQIRQIVPFQQVQDVFSNVPASGFFPHSS